MINKDLKSKCPKHRTEEFANIHVDGRRGSGPPCHWRRDSLPSPGRRRRAALSLSLSGFPPRLDPAKPLPPRSAGEQNKPPQSRSSCRFPISSPCPWNCYARRHHSTNGEATAGSCSVLFLWGRWRRGAPRPSGAEAEDARDGSGPGAGSGSRRLEEKAAPREQRGERTSPPL